MSDGCPELAILQSVSPFDSLLLEFLLGVQLAVLLQLPQVAQQFVKLLLLHLLGSLHRPECGHICVTQRCASADIG